MFYVNRIIRKIFLMYIWDVVIIFIYGWVFSGLLEVLKIWLISFRYEMGKLR